MKPAKDHIPQEYITAQEPAEISPLMAMAERAIINPDVDTGKMREVLEMMREERDYQAKLAYSKAMSAMQSELPIIPRSSKAHNSKYAKYEDVMPVLQPFLLKHGFNYTFDSRIVEGSNGVLPGREVVGTLSHRDGHSKEGSILLDIDDSGSKNSVQGVASTVSYGKRYVLQMLTNFVTQEEDDDGGKPKMTLEKLQAHTKSVRENYHSLAIYKIAIAEGDYGAAVEAWYEIDRENQLAIYGAAPTHGGLMSTEERAAMKSNEWNQASKGHRQDQEDEA